MQLMNLSTELHIFDVGVLYNIYGLMDNLRISLRIRLGNYYTSNDTHGRQDYNNTNDTVSSFPSVIARHPMNGKPEVRKGPYVGAFRDEQVKFYDRFRW